MPKKDRFPQEIDTAPGKRSGPAPKKRHSENAPTLPPPPPSSRGKGSAASRHPTARPKSAPRTSGIDKKRKPHESDIPGATVDEVVADLSRDPRREKD